MSSGHASHKSTSTKPEGNATTGQIDLGPQDPQPEEGYPYDADQEAMKNAAATRRVNSDAPEEAPEEA